MLLQRKNTDHWHISKILYIGIFIFLFTREDLLSDEKKNSKAGEIRIQSEFQWYPAGYIFGIRFDYRVSEYNSYNLRVGWNTARHFDWGRHDYEAGNGQGLSLGYRRYGLFSHPNLFLGIRMDVWKTDIHWNREFGFYRTNGASSVFVVQPTVEFGYDWFVNDSQLIGVFVSYGQEINVRTQNEKTGEGPILLLGISAGFRFY